MNEIKITNNDGTVTTIKELSNGITAPVVHTILCTRYIFDIRQGTAESLTPLFTRELSQILAKTGLPVIQYTRGPL